MVKTEIFENVDAESISAMPILNAEDVAGAVMYALGTPPHVQVNFFLIFFKEIL